MSSSRPSGVSTRHISRSNASVLSETSRQCTPSSRSIEESAKGNMASSTITLCTGPEAGHTRAPWLAGISAPSRAASPRNMPM